MTENIKQESIPLFRDKDGKVQSVFSAAEGLTFATNPLDVFIVLARYKFAARQLKKSYKVADVGIGQGAGSVLLSKFCSSVTGLDYDEKLIEQCKKHYQGHDNISFRAYDLTNRDKELDGQFDVVVSHDVIEHFDLEEAATVLNSYKSLCKSNGFAIIGTPNVTSQPYASKRRLATHKHEYNAEEYREILEENFSKVFLFGMNDEIVSTQFLPMSWYLMAICCI